MMNIEFHNYQFNAFMLCKVTIHLKRIVILNVTENPAMCYARSFTYVQDDNHIGLLLKFL